MKEKECIENGGHCYEMDNMVIDTNPPIYHRICKHCGHKQESTNQPEWRDD